MHNRLEMLRLFCAAVEAPSFKEAAARLGTSPQAVTRAVQALEQQVGELLFHRNTRHKQVTSFGAQLAIRARACLHSVDELFLPGNAHAGAPSGLVRLTAPKALGPDHMLPLMAELGLQHPGLQLDLRLSDRITDVVDERIDIGVRAGAMRDSRFVARAVADMHFFIVAAPALIARCGRPDSIAQLARLPTTAVIDQSTGRSWPWLLAGGKQWTPEAPAFSTDDTVAECAAVVSGLGFGQVAGCLAVPHIRAGRLVPVLASQAPPPWAIHIYRPQRGPVATRIRLVFDRLADWFSDPQHFPVHP